MKYITYLALNNVVEDSKYYIDTYEGKLKDRLSLTKEMAEHFNLKDVDLDTTTYSAKLEVFGIDFQVSDRVDNTGDFSDSVNLCITFEKNELDLFKKYVEMCKKDTHAQLLFDNTNDGKEMMFRFKDKHGIIWSLFYM